MTDFGPCGSYITASRARELCPCASVPAPSEGQPDRLDQLLLWASRRVFMATGYRFWGRCTDTIRPCRTYAGWPTPTVLIPDDWPIWPYPALPLPVGDRFVNVWACGHAGPSCSCTGFPSLPLPLLPVRSIVAVQIGTEVLDPSQYRLVAGAWLQRVDGGVWPACQETAPLGDPGTWGVTLQHGLDLPPEAEPLLALYACELGKLCGNQNDCQLGPGIRVTRRGDTEYELVASDDYRERGLTGFDPLDDWIALLNGPNTTTPPRLFRPGRHAPAPLLEVSP